LAKPGKRGSSRNARIEAVDLLGKWTSLSRGHVLMGGNCSCGVGAGSLQISEFEQQILDYLATKSTARGNGAVTKLLQERAGYQAGTAGSLGALLKSITTDAGPTDPAQWLAVLDDLRQTLDSFDEAHRGPR
jgi:hypothetical protein